MQIMLVFEIQIFVHQIQPVDFWFNISYSASYLIWSNCRKINLQKTNVSLSAKYQSYVQIKQDCKHFK